MQRAPTGQLNHGPGEKAKGVLQSTNSTPYPSPDSPGLTHSLTALYLGVSQKKTQLWKTGILDFICQVFLIIFDKILFGKKSSNLH